MDAGIKMLYQCLNGDLSLGRKLEIGRSAFLNCCKVSTQQKEDIVIKWMVDCLQSTHYKKLDESDKTELWKAVSTIVTSKRLRALCGRGWLFPSSTEFVHVLYEQLKKQDITIPIKESILATCKAMLSIDSLKIRVENHTQFSLYLGRLSMSSLAEKSSSNEEIEFCNLATKQALNQLKNNTDHSKTALSVLEHYILPIARVKARYGDHLPLYISEFLAEIQDTCLGLCFARNLSDLYDKHLDKYLIDSETESKTKQAGFSVLDKIVEIMTNGSKADSDVPLMDFIRIIYTGLSEKYKLIHYKFIPLVFRILGINIQSLDAKSTEGTQNLDKTTDKEPKMATVSSEIREKYIHSFLQIISCKPLDLGTVYEKTTFGVWLDSLGRSLIKTPPTTSDGYASLALLLVIHPKCMANDMGEFLTVIIHADKLTSAAYEAYANLLATIANLYYRMNQFPKLLIDLINAIGKERKKLCGVRIFPPLHQDQNGSTEHLMPLLPLKLLKTISKCVNELNQKSLLKLWLSLNYYTNLNNLNINSDDIKSEGDVMYVSAILFLVSCYVGSSPFVKITSIEGLPSKISNVMNKMMTEGLKSMLEYVHKSEFNATLYSSFLQLCHAWGELHIALSDTDTGYTDGNALLKVIEDDIPEDISYLFSELDKELLNEVTKNALELDLESQDARSVVLQLVIQKLCVIHHGRGISTENTLQLPAYTKFIATEMANNPGVAVYHLPYVIGYLHSDHLSSIAGSLVKQFSQKDSKVINYVSSRHFREARALHPYIIAAVTHTLKGFSPKGVETGISPKKRKRQSMGDDGCKFNGFYTLHRNFYKKIAKNCNSSSVIGGLRKVGGVDDEMSSVKNEVGGIKEEMIDVKEEIGEINGIGEIKEESEEIKMEIDEKVGDVTKSQDSGAMVEVGVASATWEWITECGNLCAQMLKQDQIPAFTDHEKTQLQSVIQILSLLPIAFMDRAMHVISVLIQLVILCRTLHNDREMSTNLLNILNSSLAHSSGNFKLLKIVPDLTIIQWVIDNRLIISIDGRQPKQNQSSIEDDNPCVKRKRSDSKEIKRDKMDIDVNSCESMSREIDVMNPSLNNSQETLENLYDLFYEGLLEIYLFNNQSGENVLNIAEHILNLDVKKNCNYVWKCHLSAILVNKCRKFISKQNKNGQSCRSTIQKFANWMLDGLKKMNNNEDNQSEITIGSILSIYSTLLELHLYYNDIVKPTDEKISKDELKEQRLQEVKSEAKSELEKVKNTWQEPIPAVVKIAKRYLVKPTVRTQALVFLANVAKYQKYLDTPDFSLLDIEWKCLQDHTAQEAINTIISHASMSDYETLLSDLTAKFVDIHQDHSLVVKLWCNVIHSPVYGKNDTLKNNALKHLLLLITERLQGVDFSESTVGYLETLYAILDSEAQFSAQFRAVGLNICQSMELNGLEFDSYVKVLTVLSEILNCYTVKHKDLVSTRMSIILNVYTRLVTSLIDVSSQDHQLNKTQQDAMFTCAKLHERIALQIKNYSLHVNKICHFSVADILNSIQKVPVYPAIKKILENIVYILIDLCDSHCLQHLPLIMNQETLPLLKHYNQNFTSYRRFNPYA